MASYSSPWVLRRRRCATAISCPWFPRNWTCNAAARAPWRRRACMRRQATPPLGQLQPPPPPLPQRRPQQRRPAAARRVGARPLAGSGWGPAAAAPALQRRSLLERRLGQACGQERRRPCAWKETLSRTLSRTLRLPAGAAWTAAAPTRALCDEDRLESQRWRIDTHSGSGLFRNDAQAAPAPPPMNTAGAALIRTSPSGLHLLLSFQELNCITQEPTFFH